MRGLVAKLSAKAKQVSVRLAAWWYDPWRSAPDWAWEMNRKLEMIMATLDDLITKVTELDSVEDSVIALLTDIKAQLVAAGQDPAKLQALSDSLDAEKAKLAAAVAANT